MKILVTGSSGFIGSHVYNRLKADGHEVEGFDKKNGPLQDLVVAQPPHDIDLVIHIAGSCSTSKGLSDPRQDFLDNAAASFNVFDMCRRDQIPVIYISTCKVVPNWEGMRTPYGLSKYIGELYLQEFAACYGLEYIINRCGTVYGPGQDGSPESGWLSWFMKCKREKLPLTIYGDGSQMRDVLHVKDLVELIVLQARSIYLDDDTFGTYTVGGGPRNAVTLNQMIDHLGIVNVEYADERQGDAKVYVSDNTLVEREFDWTPFIDWHAGVLGTQQYYERKKL